MLVGVNIPESWLAEAAAVLGCVDPVLSHIKAKLSGWKSRFLSYGGRLILLKSVMTSLSVYALSFFKAPSGKEYRGLGVRQLQEFNVALLGKWCWRLLVDRGGLWYRVLVARYGEVAGRLVAGDRRGSQWWREVAKIRDGVNGNEGGWFAEGVARRVGSGEDTFFWMDPWLGNVPLSALYSRLFELSEHKTSTVAAMYGIGWEEGGAAWQWRQPLRAWELEKLAECRNLLVDIVLEPNIAYLWRWRYDHDGGYNVRSAYVRLTARDHYDVDATSTLLWHQQVPVKVSILAWRLLRNRLPIKDNLAARNIIPVDSQLCASGCGGEMVCFLMRWWVMNDDTGCGMVFTMKVVRNGVDDDDF
ncbi:cysteine-rich receptor-like protein kinase, partial [Trifolium medium]|nr:cysteine-rich receptor-like protein kinase [Trifolium medium]